MRIGLMLVVSVGLAGLAGCGTLSSRPEVSAPARADVTPQPGPTAAAEAPSADASPAGDTAAPLPWEVEEEETFDPFESFNRKVYAFNSALDRNVLKPVAEVYEKAVPQFVRTGIGNLFRNLLEPTNMVNSLLQGKIHQATTDTARFFVNTTVGVLGLFDVATGMGMRRSNEDFGQTLGVWGAEEGPYLVLPFFGPRTLRDTFGFAADWFTDPVYYLQPDAARWGTRGVYYVDLRSQLLGASKVLEQATDDEYLFVREAYRQRRKSLIGGNAAPASP